MATAKKSNKNAHPTAAQLRALSDEELRGKLAETREELMQARFRHATAALENTSELKFLRRDVARMETILNQKERRG